MDPIKKKAEELDIDEIFSKIGEFGKLQKLFVLLICMFEFQKANQTLIMTLIGNSPDWKCVSNNIECNMTGIFPTTDKRRCHMERKSLEYTKYKSYSIVTEVLNAL